MNIRRKTSFFVLMALFLLTASGCSGPSLNNSDPNNKVILIVNGDKITARDLKREFAVRIKQDPSFKITPASIAEQLEVIVDRRLLIQEASRRKLAQQETFVNTIRNFWEQTLIRNLLNELTAEMGKSIKVSSQDIEDYYSKMSFKATFQVKRDPNKKTIEALEEKLKLGQDIPWDETLGPAGYETIASPALEKAFSLNVGEFKAYFENGVHYLLRVSAKESATPPPLDGIRAKIESQIKQRKQQELLENWLKEKRTQAKVVRVPNNPSQPVKKR